jgi:2-polyprenyl-6-hydroxyphenyl methylase/3-demethylubiquinone-9 3-methyltransferase
MSARYDREMNVPDKLAMGGYRCLAAAEPSHQPLYLDVILNQLRTDPSIKRVLDIGCGDGNFTASLNAAGYLMTGIDGSAECIDRARADYPLTRFFEGSAYEDLLEICGEEAFDAIVAIEVIEHLFSPRGFMERINAALKTDGLLIITTPYWGYLKNLLLAVSGRTDRALAPLWEGGHIKHWSYRTLRTLMERYGFRYIDFHGAGRWPYCWQGMVMVGRKVGAPNWPPH